MLYRGHGEKRLVTELLDREMKGLQDSIGKKRRIGKAGFWPSHVREIS